jgi:hypothetical protein
VVITLNIPEGSDPNLLGANPRTELKYHAILAIPAHAGGTFTKRDTPPGDRLGLKEKEPQTDTCDMNEKESNPLVEYLRSSGMNLVARTVGFGIPGYLLSENLPGPGIQWASGALTVAAIVASGKFQMWRADGTSSTESRHKFGFIWTKEQREQQQGVVTPLPASFLPPDTEPARSAKNLQAPQKPPTKPRGPSDETSPPGGSKRTLSCAQGRGQKPARGRKLSTDAPPPPLDEPPPPGAPRGRRQR